MKSSTYGSDRSRPKTVPQSESTVYLVRSDSPQDPCQDPASLSPPAHHASLSIVNQLWSCKQPAFRREPIYLLTSFAVRKGGSKLFRKFFRPDLAPNRPHPDDPTARHCSTRNLRSLSGSQVYHYPLRYASPTRSGSLPLPENQLLEGSPPRRGALLTLPPTREAAPSPEPPPIYYLPTRPAVGVFHAP